nr:hypothetical protein [Tanacetum cinerariifolium]
MGELTIGSDDEDADEHIENVLEIADLFHIPEELFKEKFLRKYCPPAETAKKIEEINNFQQEPGETLTKLGKELDVPTRQILDSKGAIPTMMVADAKKAIQDMAGQAQLWNVY